MTTTTHATSEHPTDWSALVRTEPHPSPASDEKRTQALRAPAFGTCFTDHMVLVDWTRDAGWTDPRLVPLGPLPLHPAAAVLHYGQEVFEGLKVYRHPDGRLVAFRPDRNAVRLRRSARRLALPEVPEGLFHAAVDALVAADHAWVPSGPGDSLYLRPFVVASEAFLGVRAADAALFGVIASPAGAYFHAGVDGISLWLSTTYSRAGRGGTGAAKCGGNYAASLVAQQEAAEHGCAQVLFTDAETGRWVEEAGSMNLFAVLADGTLVTPPTTGTILEGVTRDSVLRLAADLGYATQERPFGVDEWTRLAASGELTEVFATGTAAVITPVVRLVSADAVVETPTVGFGPVARRLHAELTGMQFGTVPDRFGWLREVGAH
ncbi:branched-chain amino acid aminotransferase [Cellulomonas composti]|uniref:Branched-chain-amino-acid aminotransferase n=1 Tax=Cellulomonas composti TaxID=266130 RepID=A0A511JDA5_9CELL|nr:branched-chain amino acid aminotransferase [Cellulomonas composti]GEL95987.1 branched-chain-amino-acid aminotransferase [Cellulomonas composti]